MVGPASSKRPAPTTPTTSGAADTATASPTAAVVAIGALCFPLGSTGTTKTGATAYCSTLQGTNTTIWSLTEDTVASPTVTATADPTEAPLPIEQESADSSVHAADRPDPTGMSRGDSQKQRLAVMVGLPDRVHPPRRRLRSRYSWCR
ncbi:serine/threonine-protein kinase pknF [Mycobacterium tuberculosis T92]|nr:serine/threonine-protein kinase pknF [Mycobacterium tuberculosis T92]